MRQARMARRITQGRANGNVVTVSVQTAGSRSASGVWMPDAPTTTTMLAATTPLTGEERDVLPESARLSDARRFWLTTPAEPLRVGAAGPTEGDLIEYDGVSWRVLRAESWPGYWVVVGVRGERDNP